MKGLGLGGSSDLSEIATELCYSLLAWWEVHGRKDPVLKPWMFTPEGKWPEPCEHLNPYPIHVAEVMRCSAASITNLISMG